MELNHPISHPSADTGADDFHRHPGIGIFLLLGLGLLAFTLLLVAMGFLFAT
jgi:hypothetical protein